MANLQAIGFDGEIIYLLAEGTGTDLDPFVSKFKLVNQDLLATDAGLTAIADLIPEFLFVDGKLSVTTDLDISGLATTSKQNDLLAKIPNGLTVDGDKLKVETEISQPLTLTELNATTVKTQESIAITSTITNVASSTSSVTLLAANTNRKTVVIVNDSTATLYVKFDSSSASTTSYTLILPPITNNTPSFATFSGSDYAGEIRGIWSTVNGSARITEVV